MVSRKGFVYDSTSRTNPENTSPENSNYANVVDEGTLENGTFSSDISNLTDNTTYYYRAFGYDDIEDIYIYGDEVSFTTEELESFRAYFNQGDILESDVVCKKREAVTNIRWQELHHEGTLPILEVTNDSGNTWHSVNVGEKFEFPSSEENNELKYRITATDGPCVVSPPIKIYVNK